VVEARLEAAKEKFADAANSLDAWRINVKAASWQHLMEDNGMKQSELVGPVFASPGIVSEILSGKRKLTLNHVKKLAEFFHTSPAIFLS
jgi:antitoxin component HigA of HigAB toxin-antitoxin module